MTQRHYAQPLDVGALIALRARILDAVHEVKRLNGIWHSDVTQPAWTLVLDGQSTTGLPPAGAVPARVELHSPKRRKKGRVLEREALLRVVYVVPGAGLRSLDFPARWLAMPRGVWLPELVEIHERKQALRREREKRAAAASAIEKEAAERAELARLVAKYGL